MPKPTFFNLPKEKQENLIQSAKKEFSRVPLNKASISNIVKNAGIPRGSFYQYFEDKEDAFYFLLEQQTKVHNREFVLTLEKNDGNLFETFEGFFRNMLTEFQSQENRDFFKNAFLNMNYKMENQLSQSFIETEFDKQFPEIIAAIDIKQLNISNEEDVIHVMQIIIAVTLQNLMYHFANRYSFEEAIKNYTFEMNLLKNGLLFKDNEE